MDPSIDRHDLPHLVPDPGDSQAIAGDLPLSANGGTAGQRHCRMVTWDLRLIDSLSQGTAVLKPFAVCNGGRLRRRNCCVDMVVSEHNKQ